MKILGLGKKIWVLAKILGLGESFRFGQKIVGLGENILFGHFMFLHLHFAFPVKNSEFTKKIRHTHTQLAHTPKTNGHPFCITVWTDIPSALRSGPINQGKI